MNRKYLLMITLFIFQSYSSLHADNWNAVFTALQGTYNENAAPTTTVRSWLKNAGGLDTTTEGKIAIDYVGSGATAVPQGSASRTAYTNALTAFLNGGTTPPTSNQLSDTVTANWTTAFAAFGSAQDVYDKKATLTRSVPTSLANASAGVKGDAQVIVQYLTGATMNATDSTNLQAAFTAAHVTTTAPSTIDTAAAALKAQIEAAKLIYNQYKPGTYTVTA